MNKFDVIFKNGKTVTENGVEDCDIAVADGKIRQIGKINEEAKIIEDVSNLLVLPGGIDAHVHIDQPSGPDVEMAIIFKALQNLQLQEVTQPSFHLQCKKKDSLLENA